MLTKNSQVFYYHRLVIQLKNIRPVLLDFKLDLQGCHTQNIRIFQSFLKLMAFRILF